MGRRLRLGLSVFLASASSWSCASAPTSPRSEPAPPVASASASVEEAPPADVRGRLPADAVPTRYALALDVDPKKDRFTGQVRIEVVVTKPSHFVVLHGRDITPSRIAAQSKAGKHAGRLAMARASDPSAPKDELVLAFDPALPAGPATIEIDYDAPFGRALDGLYRARDSGRDYAFTQFESTDARRAFPSFDEPAHKTPYQLTITVPNGMVAVANAPETARQDVGEKTRFTFAPTLPIPSYLVALAVGDFDIVEGRKTPFPIRAITTKGRGAEAQAALAAGTELVDALAHYLRVPYPYPKLDLVSVPDFGAGAMENAGLITFREETILSDPKRPSPAADRGRYGIIAHELAHQWFGDLVTMQWWDDLWLNESFATWMSERITAMTHPEYHTAIGAVRSGLGVMDYDALPSSSPVHRTVETVAEAEEAFDGITYEKGAAVLRMLEKASTPERFRDGLKAYLEARAHKSATMSDLLPALSKSAGFSLEPVAKSFLEQSGVPAVAVERDCKTDGAALVLSQYAWSPLGAPPPSQPAKQWSIPICLHQASGSPACTVMSERRLELPIAGGCSAWAYPNASQASYVRLSFTSAENAKLLKALGKLDSLERLGLLANAWASVRAGELPAADVVAMVKAYDSEHEREIVEQVIEVLGGFSVVASDEERPRVREFVRARLSPRKRTLGWGSADAQLGSARAPASSMPASATHDGDEDVRLLRRSVLYALAEYGQDEATLKEADALARVWLQDPKSLDRELGTLALELGSRHADRARFDALVAASAKATDPFDRIAALRALGAFDDPNLVTSALDYAISGSVNLKDARYVFDGALRHRASLPTLVAWVEANWERAVRRFEGPAGRRLIDPVTGLCDDKSIADARIFYKAHPVEAGAHHLESALEQASRCAALSAGIHENLARAIAGSRGAAPEKSEKAASK